MNERKKIGVYCSDVSGAFDKVERRRLVATLRKAGLHADIIAGIESWLRTRTAKVIVGGEESAHFDHQDIVFQGIVWECVLWNVVFQDAKFAIHKTGCKDIVYADDLHAYKENARTCSNDDLIADLPIVSARVA